MGVTSTEWAALIAVGGTALGAAIGGFAARSVAKQQANTAMAEGNRQRAHDKEQRRLDREQEIRLRDQERRVDACGHILLTASAYRGYTVWVGELARRSDLRSGTRATKP